MVDHVVDGLARGDEGVVDVLLDGVLVGGDGVLGALKSDRVGVRSGDDLLVDLRADSWSFGIDLLTSDLEFGGD